MTKRRLNNCRRFRKVTHLVLCVYNNGNLRLRAEANPPIILETGGQCPIAVSFGQIQDTLLSLVLPHHPHPPERLQQHSSFPAPVCVASVGDRSR